MEEELKLQIMDDTPQVWKNIVAHPLLAITQAPPLQLHAFYYDSRDNALQRARLAYRIRREDDAWVATLKASGQSAGGLHQRPEWNVPVDSNTPDLNVFQDSEAATLLAPYRELSLQVILETRFERHESRVTHRDGSEIIVALDHGEILARGQREAIREVELELAHGDAAAVLEMGAALCQDLPLIPDQESKLFRGLRLAGLLPEEKPRDNALPLRRRENAGDAFSQMFIWQLQQIIHDVRKHWAKPDAESFHELRKSVRSFRASLRFCRSLDPADPLQLFRIPLQEWFHQQNSQRDYEALLGYWTEIATILDLEPKHLQEVLQAQIPQTSGSLSQLVSILLKIWALLLRQPLHREQSLQDFSEAQLQREYRKLMAAGKLLAEHPEALHPLRIRIKNFRYVLMTLAPLWPGKDSKALLKLLTTLQGIAGEIHDADMAGQYLKPLTSQRKSGVAFQAGALLGFLMGREARQRKKFLKFWLRLESTPRPWDI
ncbi:inorganic triphosphatase [Acidithiobacillus marinus]|uniref:Inorganic triphosphatase n=1 Tax=Acidithiobacillus marinus TaxID=187490 RepID=A0A2I1DJM2_9PROT|nr:inorganic triphosphatase [Acidithiobacillus marinus]